MFALMLMIIITIIWQLRSWWLQIFSPSTVISICSYEAAVDPARVLNPIEAAAWTINSPLHSKAPELVPGTLLPHWNSMRFFATGSLYDSNSMDEVKFATLYGEVQTHHEHCNLYVTMLGLRHLRAGIVKFPKSWL